METTEFYMYKALELSKKAFDIGEVPVGAIVVHRPTGKIIGEGFNMREYGKNTNLITRKLTDAEWRDALYVMRVHQMIDVPGAVKDVEDTTPIYIYSTINLYCASLDIDKIVEKYREELKEEDLEAGEEDHYEDADQ